MLVTRSLEQRENTRAARSH